MRKIQYLDGLRGVAAFIVLLNHFVLAFYPALFSGTDSHIHLKAGEEFFLSGSIINLFYNGNFAVAIFFILSGFVISHKFLLHKDHEIITESAVKKYVRLVIPVSVSVLLAFVLMKFSLFYNYQASQITGSDWLGGFWTFTPNFLDALNQTFIGAFFTDVFEYNATLWTIAFEFLGSFLVLGFLALFGKMKNRYWIYAIAIIFFFQTYYLAFILGLLLSDLMAHKKMLINKFDKTKLIRTGLLLAGIFLGSYPSGRSTDETMYGFLQNGFIGDPVVFYHIMGAFLIIVVLLDSKRMQKFFSFKYLLFLGEISFAMYLLHFVIMGSFSSFIFLKVVPYFSYANAFLITLCLSIILIFILSHLMHLHIDKKAVQLSKLLYERIFKRQ